MLLAEGSVMYLLATVHGSSKCLLTVGELGELAGGMAIFPVLPLD